MSASASEVINVIESVVRPSLHALDLDELAVVAALAGDLAETIAKLVEEKKKLINLPVEMEAARIDTQLELEAKFGKL